MNPSAKSIINRVIVGTVLLSLGAIAGVYIGIRRDPVWVSLFTGTDLDGWFVQALESDKSKDYWRVEDGLIVCDSMGDKDHQTVWLQHALEIDDFELKLKFRAFRDSPGNSGVQVRSRWDSGPDAPDGGWMDGPQVDIHPPLPWRTGLIYDETREAKRWISPSMPDWKIEPSQGPAQWVFNFADDPQPWNYLVIRCEGTRITTTLNRMVMSDFDGKGILDDVDHRKHNVGMRGFIAFQLHARDELKLQFKDIFIREL
ncbi:MAG: DUF1080 domain-containing protein [Verrucomicrobia bacterium]|nr:DUF1080 domain-containing protein [Verrucomicrobiota bacterium]